MAPIIARGLAAAALVLSIFVADGSAAEAVEERLRGIHLTGRPGTMHRVLISFRTRPGENERSRIAALGGRVRRVYRLVPVISAHLPETVLKALAKRQEILRIEADRRIKVVDELSLAWGVARILSGQVHARGITGGGVKVAVIDTGIDYTHPDLASNYAGGWDFVGDGDPDPLDDHGHGTHVAGIVAATYDDAGVVGVAPDAEIYALKVLDQDGYGWWSDAIAALDWVVTNGIQITNNSYGDAADADGSAPLPGAVQAAFDNADASGVLNVAAAGNSGNAFGTGDNVIYPARYESVVAVAATNNSDVRASFSSTGPAVELAAPGVSITATTIGGNYGNKSGTSMASPHVAGAAALIIAAGIEDENDNGRINDEVRAVLVQSTEDLGTIGRDTEYGWGLVNAARAAAACRGDEDGDCDIDGSDLADRIAAGAGAPLDKLAESFGTDWCQNEVSNLDY